MKAILSVILIGLCCISCKSKQEKLSEAMRAYEKKQEELRLQYQDSIRRVQVKDSIEHEQRQRKWEEENRANFVQDSLTYLTEPFITATEVAELKPVLKEWLNFFGLDLAQFRLAYTNSLSAEYYLTSDDTLSPYYWKFEDDFHGKYTPQSRDYSPNKRRYINLLETTYVYQEDDGKWYYGGSDDCQEIRLVDLDRRSDRMFLFTGTQFRDGVFWKNNDCFILTAYTYNNEYELAIYDLKNEQQKVYRLKALSPEKSYLEYTMRKRGITIF